MNDPNFVVPLLAGVLLLGYLAHTALWPYTPCRACGGAGRLTHPLHRRALRPCPHCHASGLRTRPTHRIWKHLRHNRKDHP